MNYYLVRTDDMLNGSGLRVVLFLSGCDHGCKNCHNPETWDPLSGSEFDTTIKELIFSELGKDYISGLTLSGGDPLYKDNLLGVRNLIDKVRDCFEDTKTIWLYTGYRWEDIFGENLNPSSNKILELLQGFRQDIVSKCNVIVDGNYIEDLSDANYPWAGSINQRVINVKKSLQEQKVILWT